MRLKSILLAAGLAVASMGAAFAGPLATVFGEPNADKMDPRPDGPWRGYTGVLPACDDGKVLRRITWAFAEREKLYWEPVLSLQAFEIPHEVAYMPWGNEFIPRRYCRTNVLVSDGKKRPLWYSIGEGLGEASIGWGVEWCVTGLDYNRSFAPACKMARP
jgi:hypothetical protein